MYSLVSAPVLAFDLVRRPGGAQVADLLLTGLGLQPAGLSVVAAAYGGTDPEDTARADDWLAVAAAEQRRAPVSHLLREVNRACASEEPVPGGALKALECAPLGSLDALLRCLRHDVLDWTWTTRGDLAVQTDEAARAAVVLCDAVTACYLTTELAPDVRRRLIGPWTRAARALTPADVAEPEHGSGEAVLLTRLTNLDARDLHALREASIWCRRRDNGWAEAVHEAAWAAHLTGRVRAAATAQLVAVRTVLASGLSVGDSASGVWNLISGALAGETVRDLLAEDVLDVLVTPVLAALPPPV